MPIEAVMHHRAPVEWQQIPLPEADLAEKGTRRFIRCENRLEAAIRRPASHVHGPSPSANLRRPLKHCHPRAVPGQPMRSRKAGEAGTDHHAIDSVPAVFDHAAILPAALRGRTPSVLHAGARGGSNSGDITEGI